MWYYVTWYIKTAMFWRICCLHLLSWIWKQQIPQKCWYTSTRLYMVSHRMRELSSNIQKIKFKSFTLVLSKMEQQLLMTLEQVDFFPLHTHPARTYITIWFSTFILQWNLYFMNLGFTFLANLCTFAHGPGHMPIIMMLNLTDFAFLQLHIFPKFALYFSSPDYENLPDFTFCSSVLRISYLMQWTSFPVSSHKWFTLWIHTTNWLMHSCRWFTHTMSLH
jgi:hypothetical protein